MDNEGHDSVVMGPKEQLQSYMHLQRHIPLVLSTQYNDSFWHLQLNRTSSYLVVMLKMLLLTLLLLKSLPI